MARRHLAAVCQPGSAAADCVIANEFSPQVVIEATPSEDDGTACDKATCGEHLAPLS